MAFNRLFSREAQDDINNIMDNAKSPEQKQNFIEEFDKKLDILDEFPNVGKKVHKDFRVMNLAKMPFKFVYKVLESNVLFVLGVFHQRQNPKNLKDRADKY